MGIKLVHSLDINGVEGMYIENGLYPGTANTRVDRLLLISIESVGVQEHEVATHKLYQGGLRSDINTPPELERPANIPE